MKKFPIYYQPDAMDCGPSCLKMIASYYGRSLTLETLRSLSYVSKDGVSLKGVSLAAEKCGFKTIGGRFTFERLVEKAPLPCIIHWEQNHFVVVYRIIKKKKDYFIYVADPALGLVKYKKNDFVNRWISTKNDNEEKGVALIVEPTQLFYQNENLDGSSYIVNRMKFLSSYFIKYKSLFGQLILGLLVGSILQLMFPFLTQAIVDVGIGNKDVNFIWLILIAQLMLLLGRATIDFTRRRILLHISTRINVSLISDFFIKLMKLPMKFFDTKLLGDLLQRIDDHNRIEKFLTVQSLNLLFSLFSLIVFGIVLIIYSLKIFTVFFIGSLIYGFWIFYFLKRRKIIDYKLFNQQAINRSKTYQLINGMQEIKLQGCEQNKRWEWEDTQADLFEVNLSSLSLNQAQEAGSILINEIKNLLITILAATSVINSDLTIGMMLSIQYIIGQLNSPVEQIMNFIYQWQDVNISLERMNEIHSKEDEENNSKSISSFSDNTNDIQLTNLDFQYDGPFSKKVLNDINIIIPHGKVTAIVGASGSGKTTLIKLLLGNYTPTQGHIHINNEDLNNLNIRWWREQCGAVMQDGYIFSDSIAKNIAVSDNNIDLHKLKASASIANIDEFITSLPLGYNTMIGQEGQSLSQGQKQRILIARAVYKNPKFLFFDEATNALDANNEKYIVDQLKEFYKGKTVVIVAHRLSTVKDADQIIVLNNGKIVEIGNHKDLANLKGEYYQLVKNQLELGN